MKFYHMIIERIGGRSESPEGRQEYISTHQGSAPEGWQCVAVCGYHEEKKEAGSNEKA